MLTKKKPKKGSMQPRKQRKRLYNAHHAKRWKLMSAHLSPELREKYGIRSLPVRKNDVVFIMRGKYKKKRGKVVKVLPDKFAIHVEGIHGETASGTRYMVKIHPSNVMITKLDLSDKWRKRILERKGVKEELLVEESPVEEETLEEEPSIEEVELAEVEGEETFEEFEEVESK